MNSFDDIIALGTEIDMLDQDSSYAIIELPAELVDIYPFLVVHVANTELGTKVYRVVHAPREDLIELDDMMVNDLLYYMYKHYLVKIFLELDNSFDAVYVEEEKANNYLRQLFKLDRKVIEKLKREFTQTTSLTLQKRNSTLLG